MLGHLGLRNVLHGWSDLFSLWWVVGLYISWRRLSELGCLGRRLYCLLGRRWWDILRLLGCRRLYCFLSWLLVVGEWGVDGRRWWLSLLVSLSLSDWLRWRRYFGCWGEISRAFTWVEYVLIRMLGLTCIRAILLLRLYVYLLPRLLSRMFVKLY
mmetsp:Transcript_28831/g.5216  ORF Transcript_28831/g.5216 Transcript_28831/m.5216 type:complete len:155 (-) Transcript_28831:2240-2704(-)